jgi:hypothetical protein
MQRAGKQVDEHGVHDLGVVEKNKKGSKKTKRTVLEEVA